MGDAKREDSAGPMDASNANGDTSTSPKPLRRACDCCRKRKVKCDGDHPCGPCKKASIQCAYLQKPQKKGPKGLRSARVLHALRRIDHDVSGGHTSPLSPEQHGAFGNWGGWNQQTAAPNGLAYPENMVQQQREVVYGPSTSVPPDQSYFPQLPTSMPRPQPVTQHSLYQQNSQPQNWPPQPDSVSASSDIPQMLTPTTSEPLHLRLPGETFLPYMHMFFQHMFTTMPIIDRGFYLDPNLYANSNTWSADMYCFICSICATAVVQLDESIPQPPPLHPTKRADDVFADECLRERKTFDYVESTSTLSIMTSFFLFCYYGNHEKSGKAWHYLQESITFCENLNMDDDHSYAKLESPVEAEWRRRLYWLLFVTERAYAMQRRKHTRLYPSVQLPTVFENEEPILVTGFIMLSTLFSVINEDFVRAWRGSRKASLCNEAWLSQTQDQLDKVALAMGNITETQHLDINVTREWLHVLAWQMGVSNGLIWRGEGDMSLDYPIELARKVVEITSSATAMAMDSHGIGMEQKLSDIAGCLADVLKCRKGDTSPIFFEGKQYLDILLHKLSKMRGKESRYLRPLREKIDGQMGYELSYQTLPLPTETTASLGSLSNQYLDVPRLSMTDPIGMLSTLSMSGNLGMPGLNVPVENFNQRRESGKVYEEVDMDAIDSWFLSSGGGVAQAV